MSIFQPFIFNNNKEKYIYKFFELYRLIDKPVMLKTRFSLIREEFFKKYKANDWSTYRVIYIQDTHYHRWTSQNWEKYHASILNGSWVNILYSSFSVKAWQSAYNWYEVLKALSKAYLFINMQCKTRMKNSWEAMLLKIILHIYGKYKEKKIKR